MMNTWEFEFVIECIDKMGKVIHTYTSIEADTEEDAKAVAEEFCRDDFPGCELADTVIKSVINLADIEQQAEIAEYERIANTNPYIFKEDEI